MAAGGRANDRECNATITDIAQVCDDIPYLLIGINVGVADYGIVPWRCRAGGEISQVHRSETRIAVWWRQITE